MVEPTLAVSLDESKAFARALEQTKKRAEDIRPALLEILDDWYASEAETFQYGDQGPYRDLTDLYKKRKEAKHGFVYPILKATGALEESVTHPSGAGAYFSLAGDTITIGSYVSYASYVQAFADGSSNRPFIFIGGRYATENQKARPKRWAGILRDYIRKEGERGGLSW